VPRLISFSSEKKLGLGTLRRPRENVILVAVGRPKFRSISVKHGKNEIFYFSALPNQFEVQN